MLYRSAIQGAGCGWRGLAHTTVVAFPTAHVLARGKGAGAPGEVTEAAVDDAGSTGSDVLRKKSPN